MNILTKAQEAEQLIAKFNTIVRELYDAGDSVGDEVADNLLDLEFSSFNSSAETTNAEIMQYIIELIKEAEA